MSVGRVTALSQDVAHSRGARRKSETRRRLLRAARTVFAREGLENATIAQITSAADVGFGTFYLHFGSKEEAYRAVVTDGFEELARLLDEARVASSARGEPWWTLARVSIAAYYEFAERNRELFLVMFVGGRMGEGLGRELQEQFADALAAQLTVARERAQADGQPAPFAYPAEPVALVCVVALTRAIVWRLGQADEQAPSAQLGRDAFVETMTRFITAALWGQAPGDDHMRGTSA